MRDKRTGVCSGHLIITLCLAVICLQLHGQSVIEIHTQSQFENLLSGICRNLESGSSEVTIHFFPGQYYYSDRMLCLDALTYPNARLTFVGNGAILTGKGEKYSNGDTISEPLMSGTGVISGTTDLFLWSTVFQSDSSVRIVDKKSRLCRLKCKALKKDICADLHSCYIILTEWYQSKMLKVTEINDGEIYFFADEDLDGLNADLDYGSIYPRFKILNTNASAFYVADSVVHTSPGLESVYVCRAGRLVSAYGAKFKSISFDGFRFIGNQDNVFALIDFTETISDGISITNCEFCGLRSKLVQVAFSPNFTFSDNYIHDCYRGGVNFVHSSNARIQNNIFDNTGLALNNDFCISCAGENCLIADNKISDFGYGGIAVGLHYASQKTSKITGTVKNNELWYTSDYFANYPEHTLMDSGAIYAYTQNDRAMIRDNYIHDYIGMRDNRGIFLDDGASHVIIINNTIQNTPNSWSIDSRLVKDVVSIPGSYASEFNTGNLIYGNKVDGKIRFEKR